MVALWALTCISKHYATRQQQAVIPGPLFRWSGAFPTQPPRPRDSESVSKCTVTTALAPLINRAAEQRIGQAQPQVSCNVLCESRKWSPLRVPTDLCRSPSWLGRVRKVHWRYRLPNPDGITNLRRRIQPSCGDFSRPRKSHRFDFGSCQGYARPDTHQYRLDSASRCGFQRGCQSSMDKLPPGTA